MQNWSWLNADTGQLFLQCFSIKWHGLQNVSGLYIFFILNVILGAVLVVIVWYWIYNYLCNQWISPLMLFVHIPFRRVILDTTLLIYVFTNIMFFHRQNIFHTIDLVLYFPQLVTVCKYNRSECLKKVNIESISHC
jgi:hypothetical protein